MVNSHRVRTLYVEHYERQRRLLNLNDGGNQHPLGEPLYRRGLLGRVLGYIDERGEPIENLHEQNIFTKT